MLWMLGFPYLMIITSTGSTTSVVLDVFVRFLGVFPRLKKKKNKEWLRAN